MRLCDVAAQPRLGATGPGLSRLSAAHFRRGGAGDEESRQGLASLDLTLPLPLLMAKTGKLTLSGQWLSAGVGTMAPGGVSDSFTWHVR
jgi:hypothetical protein